MGKERKIQPQARRNKTENPKVVSQSEWVRARLELLKRNETGVW